MQTIAIKPEDEDKEAEMIAEAVLEVMTRPERKRKERKKRQESVREIHFSHLF